MSYQNSITFGRGLPIALATAGPSFVLHLLMAEYFLQFPNPVSIDVDALGVALIALLPIMIAGAFVSLIPCIFGTLLMSILSREVAPLRHPVAWLLMGAAFGLAFCFLTDMEDVHAWTAFVSTAALCGRLCRIGVY